MYCNMFPCSRFLLLASLVLFGAGGAGGQVADFEDLIPTIAYSGAGGGDYENGENLTPVSTSTGDWNETINHNVFISGGIGFKNEYVPDWGSWTGWAYSNTTDTDTDGVTNQFSAYTGGGVHGSTNYAVYYDGYWGGAPPTVTGIPAGTLLGAYFTNTTYAALSMLEGDGFAKQFEAGDFFTLTITGLDASDNPTGSIDVALADYTGGNESILDEWLWVDLTGLNDLGGATQLQFSFTSSDVGDFGINTPRYFAMDNLTLIPEPTSFLLLLCGAAAMAAGFGRGRKRQAF